MELQPLSNLPSLFIKSESELELSPKTYQCARLEALGFKSGDISERLGVSASWISMTRKSPLYKQTVLQLEKEINEGATRAKKMLLEKAPLAAETLIKILEDRDDDHIRLRKEVAIDIAKGLGTLNNTQNEGPKIQINISDSKLDLIMQTLKEL